MAIPGMRLVIVEDEAPARERIRRLLNTVSDVEIIGEATNGHEGLTLIEREQPDIVILDINMPEVDGMRMLEALDDPPFVIFSTAYDHHAVRAFELEAADYLLKPYSAERLRRALDRVRRQFAIAHTASSGDSPDRIPAENGRDVELVDPASIVVARIEESVVFILRDDGEQLLHPGTLQQLEEKLPSGLFLRASRKAVVNADAIISMTPTDEGGLLLRLKGGLEENVSRRRARYFRARLND